MTETTLYIIVIASLAVNAMILYIVIASATKSSKVLYTLEMQLFYLKKIADAQSNGNIGGQINTPGSGPVGGDSGITDLNEPGAMDELLKKLNKDDDTNRS